MISDEILEAQEGQVASMFRYYRQMMQEQIEFWQLTDGIDIHTESHCERVLLLALKLGDLRELKLRSMIALSHASIFHDTRRKDNYLDQGHGDRAAEYYREFCDAHNIKYLPEVYATIKYHDRDDAQGEEYIRKEAPKHSLASEGEKSDDTEEQSRSLMPFAQQLVKDTIDEETMKKVMEVTRPFAERMKRGE